MNRPVLNFKGLMAPVFTLFNKDGKVDTTKIDDYAFFLKNKGIHGVLVNGTTGEGPALTLTERKLTTEAWKVSCDTYKLNLMVQIGGCPLPDVIDLAKHAEALKVGSVLCLPELYFKPKTEKDLVEYLKNISAHCPNTPFLYYHIPMFTGLNLHMPTFCDLAEKEIRNFVGIKYTSDDLGQGSGCLKPGRNIFLGADTILSGAIMLGFDSAIMTTLNIFPELAIKIFESFEQNNIAEIRSSQNEISKRVKMILLEGGGEWVKSMKLEFNKNVINAGSVRRIF